MWPPKALCLYLINYCCETSFSKVRFPNHGLVVKYESIKWHSGLIRLQSCNLVTCKLKLTRRRRGEVFTSLAQKSRSVLILYSVSGFQVSTLLACCVVRPVRPDKKPLHCNGVRKSCLRRTDVTSDICCLYEEMVVMYTALSNQQVRDQKCQKYFMYHAKRTIAGVRPQKFRIFSYFVSRFTAKTGKYEDSRVEPGAGENTLRRLAHFLCLDHPTKSDVTSGKKTS